MNVFLADQKSFLTKSTRDAFNEVWNCQPGVHFGSSVTGHKFANTPFFYNNVDNQANAEKVLFLCRF